jgi:hypothetical protein
MTKSRALVAAVALVVALGACTNARDVPEAGQRCEAKLGAAFGAWARAGFSGSVAVSTGGRFDCLSGWGSANDAAGVPNTVDTVFSIGSITKAVTAATILDLVEAGELTLDDRAGSLLPELTGPAAGPPAATGRYRLDTGGTLEVTGAGNRITVAAAGVDAVSALFPPGGGVSAADFRANERRVLELLAGRTREGRTERESLERDFGAIRGVDLAGTLSRDGEVRSYVTIAAGRGPVTGWYALDAAGGIEAAEVPTGPPAATFVRAGGETYRPDDPTGGGPEVTVELRDGRLTVTGPAGPVVARPAG